MTLADTPRTWLEGPSISTIEVIAIFVGIPLLVIVAISLLVYAPSWVRGPRYRPGQPWDNKSEWFGTALAASPSIGALDSGMTASESASDPRGRDLMVSEDSDVVRRGNPQPTGRPPSGEAFTDAQRQGISRAVADAERASGWAFALEVGPSADESRGYAEALHARLPDPTRSILVQVDPGRGTLEIVTGTVVSRVVTERGVALVAVTMQSGFASGDLTRGLVAGVRQLGQLSRTPKALHTDTP